MNSVFLKAGNTWRVSSEETLDMHKKLPAGNYIVRFNSMTGCFYLEKTESFELPKKLYGKINKHAERIMHTFNDREAITGVLLEGEKGSGKTLLAKKLSVIGAALGMPTLIVNTGEFAGDAFNQFIQTIEQPAIILMDEFEKNFDADQQEKMLTFLDGVCPTKKLCVLTINDKWSMDTHMLNRPGRLFYMISYSGLSEEFIREYCQDVLNNKTYIEDVVKVSSFFRSFNFDSLQAIVQEMNRFRETVGDALEILNVRPDSDGPSTYSVSLMIDGVLLDHEKHDVPNEWSGSPLGDPEHNRMQFFWTHTTEEYAEKSKLNKDIRTGSNFNPSDYDDRASGSGRFVFKNTFGDVLVLTRKKQKEFNFRNAF